jgi:hypothetical protein
LVPFIKKHLKHILIYGTFTVLLIGFAIPQVWNLIVGPSQARNKRDEKRLLDTSFFENQFEEYFEANGYYPVSITQAPYIDSSAEADKNIAWIESLREAGNMILPIDPINKKNFIYRYKSNKPPSDLYEFDIRLEGKDKNKMKTDGGDSDNWYEVGNDLTLMSD